MLSHYLPITRTGAHGGLFSPKNPTASTRPQRVVVPRAQVDLTTTWPLLSDSVTQGAGFAMMAAFAQNALTSLPSKKAEQLAATGQRMEPLQQFSFLCEKAIPEGVSGTLIGIAAALYMSQAGFAPPDPWAAAMLTGAGARGTWWLRSRG